MLPVGGDRWSHSWSCQESFDLFADLERLVDLDVVAGVAYREESSQSRYSGVLTVHHSSRTPNCERVQWLGVAASACAGAGWR